MKNFNSIPSLVSHISGYKTKRSSGRGQTWCYLCDDEGEYIRGSVHYHNLLKDVIDSKLVDVFKMTHTQHVTKDTYLCCYTNKKNGWVGSFLLRVETNDDILLLIHYQSPPTGCSLQYIIDYFKNQCDKFETISSQEQ